MDYHVSAFYALRPIALELQQEWRAELLALGLAEPALRGLVILAPDGVNATIAAPADSLARAEAWFGQRLAVDFKRSRSSTRPFRRWKVLLRKETVTTGLPLSSETSILSSGKEDESHLTPAQWHAALQEEGVIVVDVRNTYEVAIGHFPNALDPHTVKFTEFLDYVDNLPRERKILTYCTGGIRCEKAVPLMQAKGFSQVYQLEGGILKYLEEFPGSTGLFRGECFVFDERVALDTDLQPSREYCLCAQCGQPAPRTSGICSNHVSETPMDVAENNFPISIACATFRQGV